MKKIIVSILATLICFQFGNINSYAECHMDNLDIDKINFEKLIKSSNQKSIIQTVEDKEVTVTRLEDFSKQNYILERNIINEIKKFVKTENSAIDSDLLTYMIKQVYSILSGTSPDMGDELTKIANKVNYNDLKELSEEEKVKAITDGKNKAEKVVSTGLAIGTAATTVLWAVAKRLAEKGIGKIVESTAVAAGAVSMGVAVGAAVLTTTALVLGGFCYNQFYVLPLSNKLRNLIEVHKDIFRQVRDAVLDHKWIGNNVLVTATPTDSSCMNGYASFHNVAGINFNKPKKAIDWEFAKSECKFLEQDNYDCRKQALSIINCLQENQDDPSRCEENLYYTSANDRFNLLD